VLLFLHDIAMDGGVKCLTHLGRRAGEFNGGVTGIDPIDLETMRSQPDYDGVDILLSRAELLAVWCGVSQ